MDYSSILIIRNAKLRKQQDSDDSCTKKQWVSNKNIDTIRDTSSVKKVSTGCLDSYS